MEVCSAPKYAHRLVPTTVGWRFLTITGSVQYTNVQIINIGTNTDRIQLTHNKEVCNIVNIPRSRQTESRRLVFVRSGFGKRGTGEEQ